MTAAATQSSDSPIDVGMEAALRILTGFGAEGGKALSDFGACLVPLLLYLCMQTDHARMKGTPMNTWRLIPLIFTAATFAFLGKRFLNSIAGLFLGGIGGAFGTLDSFAGPYGGVVGLLVGAIVIAIPIMHKPRTISTTTEVQATENAGHRPLGSTGRNP